MANRNRVAKQLLIPIVAGWAIGLSPIALKGAEYELGLEAFNKGQYTKAFRLIKLSAKEGDVKSLYILSTLYRRGLGIEADEYEGFNLCKMAAEEGHLEAQFQLGLMYLEGEGVTADETEAQNWLWTAADRGYPQASEVLQYIFSDEYADEFNIGC